MAEKVYTESEVKKLMGLAYDEGNNYAYYCTIYPHERKDSAREVAIDNILKRTGKHLGKQK